VPTTDLPDWLAKIAVAEAVSADLLVLVAGASGVSPPDDVALFIRDLVERGILHRKVGEVAEANLLVDDDLHSSMLDELNHLPGGVHQVRDELLHHGLSSAPPALPSLLGQLAIWAGQNEDWTALAELWLRYPPLTWANAGPKAIEVFAGVPAHARRTHPALTQGAAVTAGLTPAKSGTFSDQTEAKFRQDGRLLHAGWRSHRDVDSILRAGSLWMVGERTMPGTADPLGDSWRTHEELSALIESWTRDGHPPTSRAQTFFHEMSAETALLRGDLYEARLECEQSMMLSHSGDISALAAAGLAALTLIITGNVHGYERACVWYEANAPACGPFAAIAEPYFQLARAMAALRLLERDAAAAHLRLASALEQGSEFWSIYAWINSLHDLTWRNPTYGLSRLEAAEASAPAAGEHESLSEAMATRARAELLCGAGRINQAIALLKARGHSRLNRYHLVSEARIRLCGQDGVAAVRVADSGLYDPTIHLPDRAELFAIKSAALLLDGADDRLVRESLHAACTLSSESANVLPFVFIPVGLRTGLLELHDRHPHSSPCLIDDEEVRVRLAEVRENFGSTAPWIRLTPREEVLLPLLATRETAEEIARRLQVSVNTVRKQVATLREKFSAPDRASLVATAYELGLLDGHEGEH
jgi:DNA-binding CsgD family transcriptional regulator